MHGLSTTIDSNHFFSHDHILLVFNSLQARTDEINSFVNGRNQGRKSLSSQIVDGRNHLLELSMQYNFLLNEKNAIKEELEMVDKVRERMRKEAISLRDKLFKIL